MKNPNLKPSVRRDSQQMGANSEMAAQQSSSSAERKGAIASTTQPANETPNRVTSSGICSLCKGTGIVSDKWTNDLVKKNPTVHTCWACLKAGRLDGIQ